MEGKLSTEQVAVVIGGIVILYWYVDSIYTKWVAKRKGKQNVQH